MRIHSRMISLLLLIIGVSSSQLYADSFSPPTSFAFHLKSMEEEYFELNQDISSFIVASEAHNIIRLREGTAIGEWTRVTITYKNLEISYFEENKRIYFLKTTSSNWLINNEFSVGNTVNGVQLSKYHPITIPNGFLVPFLIYEGGRKVDCYLEVRLDKSQTIIQLALSLAVD